MGGGGSYYDRDVSDKKLRTRSGFTSVAEEKFQRRSADEAVLPKNRRLICNVRSPVVLAMDDTGSMGNLPKIFTDKTPMVAGQLAERKYLEDVEISLAGIGDVISDDAPIQVADFSAVRNLDNWLERLWLEGNGGGQHFESYEFMAYFYAKYVEMPNAETPMFIFTGDEGFREELLATDLTKHFGGRHKKTSAKEIFDELKRKFKGNVFLIHRYYQDARLNEEILRQWQGVLGETHVIEMGPQKNDLAIADIMLGLFAIIGGKQTLVEYLNDMRARGQDEHRCNIVFGALKDLALAKHRHQD